MSIMTGHGYKQPIPVTFTFLPKMYHSGYPSLERFPPVFLPGSGQAPRQDSPVDHPVRGPWALGT